jgi:hypothetical protein
MGDTPFPSPLIMHLARLHRADVFVETGTYIGTTTRWAAGNFAEVHTIELLEPLFLDAVRMFASLPHVRCHFGDSCRVLPEIVAALGTRKRVLWLDGHCCCNTGGVNERDECPLLCELACVTPDDIVLIDDARLFLRTPPAPHDAAQWPSIRQVIDAIPSDFVQVIGDVIWAVPDALRPAMVEYLRANRSPW